MSNIDQSTPRFEDYLFEPNNFDAEMVDPAIPDVDLKAIADDVLTVEGSDSSDMPIDLTSCPPRSPPKLDKSSIEFIRLEAPVRSNYMYPSPVKLFVGWPPLEHQIHTHPGYGDYATTPDEEDFRCLPPAPAPTSASSYSGSDAAIQLTTPSPSLFRRNNYDSDFLSTGTTQDRLFLTRSPTSRELSPTPGARGHETFIEAASAILDLPISWRGNGTLREFLEEEDEEGYVSDEDEMEEIDYTTDQFTAKMRQPDFHRADYQVFPDLGGPKVSLDDASISDNSKLGAIQKPTRDDDATIKMPPTATPTKKDAMANVIKAIGPFSLASTEAEPSDN
ncbi:hypothetical protein TRV_00442 [Trichophyton verrucosum HKI 0517]|uniref:Uncharacterized protein n=1 Tax=Trichophyton verrucosum (strain HKI 0517) TaxID=663202 RepID=D4D048_TRIVH|nr:uncharacterized protein TRV_00442 [Trichophyton verrucosum HKI 0517]EFE44770.1 hypothetical protein TRV_00442 [Trichophyton verrucosum HKI 0517]